jgi:hypothetical protein
MLTTSNKPHCVSASLRGALSRTPKLTRDNSVIKWII